MNMEIKWEKYKIESESVRKSKRNLDAFIDFNNKVFELEGLGFSDYYGQDSPIEIYFNNLTINTKPYSFRTQIYKATKNFLDKCREEGDKFIGFEGVDSRNIPYVKFNDGKTDIVLSRGVYSKFCSARRRFKKAVEDRGFQLVGSYKGNKEEVDLICDKGHNVSMIPTVFLQGFNCKYCSGNCKEVAKEKFLKEIKKRGYKVLEEYINTHKGIKAICDKGHNTTIVPSAFMTGRKCCPTCTEKSKGLSELRFREYCESLNYKVVGEYKSGQSAIEIICDNGHKFEGFPSSMRYHQYKCPKCSLSRGEKIIHDYCVSLGKKVSTQLILANKKRYDIYLEEDNLIIEIHGKQHYKETFYNIKGDKRGRRNLQQEQENDRVKEEYARSLNYNYMVIDYKEGNPKLTLERFKKQYADFLKEQ